VCGPHHLATLATIPIRRDPSFTPGAARARCIDQASNPDGSFLMEDMRLSIRNSVQHNDLKPSCQSI